MFTLDFDVKVIKEIQIILQYKCIQFPSCLQPLQNILSAILLTHTIQFDVSLVWLLILCYFVPWRFDVDDDRDNKQLQMQTTLSSILNGKHTHTQTHPIIIIIERKINRDTETIVGLFELVASSSSFAVLISNGGCCKWCVCVCLSIYLCVDCLMWWWWWWRRWLPCINIILFKSTSLLPNPATLCYIYWQSVVEYVA